MKAIDKGTINDDQHVYSINGDAASPNPFQLCLGPSVYFPILSLRFWESQVSPSLSSVPTTFKQSRQNPMYSAHRSPGRVEPINHTHLDDISISS